MSDIYDPYADERVSFEELEIAWREYEEVSCGGGVERGAAVGLLNKTMMAANSIHYYLMHCGHRHTQEEVGELFNLAEQLRYFDENWRRPMPSRNAPGRFTQ